MEIRSDWKLVVACGFLTLIFPKPEVVAASALRPAEVPGQKSVSTLLLYDGEARPFTLLDVRELVVRLLGRVDTEIVQAPADDAALAHVDNADYVVLLGLRAPASIPEALVAALSEKPTLAVGTAVEALDPSLRVRWGARSAASKHLQFAKGVGIRCREAQFQADVTSFFPVPRRASDPPLVEASWQGASYRLAWRTGQNFCFAALPVDVVSGALFSDILLDFYGISQAGESGVLLVVDGFQTETGTIRDVADTLHARDAPFVVTTPWIKADAPPAVRHEFVSTLRYVQARGGRLAFSVSGNPFWDAQADRPAGDTPMRSALAALEEQFRASLADGLFPLGLRLPQDGFGKAAGEMLAPHFPVVLGTLPPSDATASATLPATAVTRTPSGLVVLPLSPWWDPKPSPAQRDLAANLLKLRGMVLGISLPAWLAGPDMREAVEILSGFGVPFLDLLEAPAMVSTPQALLLVGSSPRVRPPFQPPWRIRSFNAQGLEIFSRDHPDGVEPIEFPQDATWLTVTPKP